MTRKHSHYFKPVPAGVTHVDVYRVLEMFGVTDPCLQHAVKKLLVAGGRGAGKDITKDVQEAVDTLQRRLEMWREDAGVTAPYVGEDRRDAPVADDIWIEWKGGECPVETGLKLYIRHRSGLFFPDIGGVSRWQHIGDPSDIIAYRVIPNGR